MYIKQSNCVRFLTYKLATERQHKFKFHEAEKNEEDYLICCFYFRKLCIVQ